MSAVTGSNKGEKRLLKRFRKLSPTDQKTLLDLAEFLLQRESLAEKDQPLSEPQAIPRPAQETVIKAIKRLSDSYHMVDRARILNETSALMAQHVMQGRAAEEIIDKLEALFAAQYQQLRDQDDSP